MIHFSFRNSKKASERLKSLINEINESEEAIRKAQEENQALDEEGVKLNEETKTVAVSYIDKNIISFTKAVCPLFEKA